MYKFPIIFSQDFYIRFLEDFDSPLSFLNDGRSGLLSHIQRFEERMEEHT